MLVEFSGKPARWPRRKFFLIAAAAAARGSNAQWRIVADARAQWLAPPARRAIMQNSDHEPPNRQCRLTKFFPLTNKLCRFPNTGTSVQSLFLCQECDNPDSNAKLPVLGNHIDRYTGMSQHGPLFVIFVIFVVFVIQ